MARNNNDNNVTSKHPRDMHAWPAQSIKSRPCERGHFARGTGVHVLGGRLFAGGRKKNEESEYSGFVPETGDINEIE